MDNADNYSLDYTEGELIGRPSRSNLRYAVAAIILPLVGAGLGYWWGSSHNIPIWKPVAGGAASFLGIALAFVFMRAVSDTKRMAVANKAQNLVEDAWTAHALGDVDKAEKLLTEALQMSVDSLGAADLTTLMSLHALANLYRVRKQYGNADNYYTQALALYQKVLPPNHRARANLHYHWALNFEGRKDLKKALDQAEQSIAVWRKVKGDTEMEKAEVLCYLGRLYFEQEQDEKAATALGEGLDLQNRRLGLKHPTVHASMSYLSRIYVRLRRYKESEAHLVGLIAELDQSREPDYLAMTEAHLDLGLIRMEQGRNADAEPLFVRALQLLQHYVGPNERLLQRVLDGYERIMPNVDFSSAAGVVHFVRIFYGERERLRSVLEANPHLVNARDNTGWGPIQWATFIGREDIVRWLLARGADPGYDSDRVMGPVHVACAWDQPDLLYLLLEKDPNLNARGPGGWTPIFWCTLTGRHRLIEILLKRGAEVNVRDDYGRTPLHIATARNHLATVACLLSAGADVNAKEAGTGGTAMHLGAERGFLAICDCMIYNGADLEAKDNQGRTPLQLAQTNKHHLLARAFKKHLKAGMGKVGKKK